MTIKIEKIQIPIRGHNNLSLKEFVVTLGKLEVGQSFLYKMSAYHRNAISVVQYLTDKRFITRAEGDKHHRVMRIE